MTRRVAKMKKKKQDLESMIASIRSKAKPSNLRDARKSALTSIFKKGK